MKLTRPPFVEGVHWERIPRSQRNGRPWKYRLLKNVAIEFYRPICFGNYFLYDGDGNIWGVITPRMIKVMANYSWNGSSCSPDWRVLLASLPHDLLYQFSGGASFPFSRTFCDDLFLALAESPFSPLYRLGLLVGGWACWGKHEPGLHIVT